MMADLAGGVEAHDCSQNFHDVILNIDWHLFMFVGCYTPLQICNLWGFLKCSAFQLYCDHVFGQLNELYMLPLLETNIIFMYSDCNVLKYLIDMTCEE